MTLVADIKRSRLEFERLIDQIQDDYTEQEEELERLWDFIEELRDFKPEIHSGRQQDPQDDVPDVMEVETFVLFQEDAAELMKGRNQ